MNCLILNRATKRLLLLFFSGLFLWLVLVASVTASASGTPQEQTAVVRISELNMLDNKLDQLSQINGRLLNESNTQKVELQKSQEALKRAQAELRLLRSQLAEARALSQNQISLLETANQSLQQYAKEEKARRLRIKAQRNMWIAGTIFACLGLVVK